LDLFEDIKNGILPEEKVLFELLEYNKKFDKNKEIDKYIKVINQAYSDSNLEEEKILFIRVLFILENYLDKQMAIYNFIKRSVTLNINNINKYNQVFLKFIDYFEVKFVLSILNKIILELSRYNDKDLRSFFNWCSHIIWNQSRFLNNKEWATFYDNLKSLLNELIAQDRISSVMYVEFFTYHIMGNSFQKIEQWYEFNKNITQKTAPFYEKWGQNLPKPSPTKKKKKRIAFIKDRLVLNSVFQTEYSLFKSLKESEEFNENYEIAVYSANYFEKSQDFDECIKMLEEINVPYINPVYNFLKDGYYNDHYQKALKLRETLINDDIDIIIMGGVFPILDFLYLNRTAPMQIYYSHGNCAFDIKGIDKRISHFEQECKEFEWNIFNVTLDKKFLIGTKDEKQVAEIIKQDYLKKFGEDTVILGTIGRLVKIDSDEYIQTIAKIMKQNPNTIYLAGGVGNENNIREKTRKHGIEDERFIFLGQVNPHIYGWIIDVYLAPFKLSGQALEEYRYKGKAYVSMYNNSHNIEKDIDLLIKKIKDEKFIQYKADLYTKKDIEFLKKYKILNKNNTQAQSFMTLSFAKNTKEYINIANEFINNKELREKSAEEFIYYENKKIYYLINF